MGRLSGVGTPPSKPPILVALRRTATYNPQFMEPKSWLRRQWEDLKGHFKWWLICLAGSAVISGGGVFLAKVRHVLPRLPSRVTWAGVFVLSLLVFLLSTMHNYKSNMLEPANSRNVALPVVSGVRIRLISEDVEYQPTATFPLKVRCTMRNDSGALADVQLSEYKASAVTLKKFVTDVLQIKLRKWYPPDEGVERVAVLVGQVFKLWVGVDEGKFNEHSVNQLKGQMGTLVLTVNGEEVDVPL